jgi:hypothetical protein
MVTGLDWDGLVSERNEWVSHNFPAAIKGQSVFGVIEELGELAHSDLKQAQSIRGTAEEHEAAAKDAIGDVTIYLLGVMHHNDCRPNEHFIPMMQEQADTPAKALLYLASWVGRLARAEATGKRHSEYPLVVTAIVYYLVRYCHLREWPYDIIVIDTWRGVSKRDWIAYPDTGMPSVEA